MVDVVLPYDHVFEGKTIWSIPLYGVSVFVFMVIVIADVLFT